ncbi:hypothetical protein NDU88_001103 [Pleurodeles waltl]|uniref:Uncharacterized protein n=1 Tax=Pleurodeles waltl TaxID=8319 RepID=A0AAV7USF0_PLEWA|nr:hypothetical protein NDU88_001103 [Pleurodeles waltl]
MYRGHPGVSLCVYRRWERSHLSHPTRGLSPAALFSAQGDWSVLYFRFSVTGCQEPQRLRVSDLGVPVTPSNRDILLISGGP